MNENPLLDAVDALTKPHTLVRFTGTSHDHFWTELVRSTTPEERAVAKAEKRKLPRTVQTGEWWCMFCDETRDTKPADEVPQMVDRHDDLPLLDQLSEHVRGSLGDRGVRGANTGGSPIDTAAFELERQIRDRVLKWMRELGGNAGRGLSLTQLLRSWYTLRQMGSRPVGEDDLFVPVLRGWRTEVLDVLEPPDQIPYRGEACPVCGETRAVRDVDGMEVSTVALWAFLRPEYRDEGSYGLCRACNTVLGRDSDPLMLRRKMNDTVSGRRAAVWSSDTPGGGGVAV